MKNTLVQFGAEIYLEVYCLPIENLHMSDYDFRVLFYTVPSKSIILTKSEMTLINDDTYSVNINTEHLGLGIISCVVLADLPSGTWNSAVVATNIQIIKNAVTNDDLKISVNFTESTYSVFNTNEGNLVSSDGKLLKVLGNFYKSKYTGEEIDNILEGSVQEYYDDGTGEVVPVKHPDLSTQPSILPYKFAGNYVYEQMVWVDGEKFSDYNIAEIDLIKFQDYELDIKGAVLIDHHVFVVGHEYFGNYAPLPYDTGFCFNIVSNNKKIFFERTSGFSITCKGAWVRLVYAGSPNAGEYYYAPESKYNFYIKGFEGLSFSIDGEPIDDSVKLPDNLVERFISGTDIIVDAGNESIGWVVCEETSEHIDKTGSYLNAIVLRSDDYHGIVSIEYAFPIAAERIQKGEKVTLIFKRA